MGKVGDVWRYIQNQHVKYSQFDADDDGKLSRSEYLLDPFKDLSPDEMQIRNKEFSDVLDKNKDGVADKYDVKYTLCIQMC